MLPEISILDELPKRHAMEKSVEAESVHSGVEIVTSKKSLNPDEPETTVPGIGVIHTFWVGQKGKDEIQKLVEEDRGQPLIKSLRSELFQLSKECLTAFDVAGLLKSTDAQVQKAINLCQKYTSKGSKRHTAVTNDRLQKLWSTNKHPHTNEDITTAATSILGKELVDSITEEHREPPDVSNASRTQ